MSFNLATNERFPEIWEILIQHLNFKDKKLIDVGCGYGDLIVAARHSGALVTGIDFDIDLVNNVRARYSFEPNEVICEDIDNWFLPKYEADIVTCFSVLPYLTFPWDVVRDLKKIAPQVVLEIQYAGDGPGFIYIRSDEDCQARLGGYFGKVKKIGETLVADRNKKRSIWLCES